MQTAIALGFTLIVPMQAPDYAAGIAALETALEVAPNPDILLSIASTYEQWDGHCRETIETYRRFFATCEGCAQLGQAADRFDLALERCVSSAEEEITLREQFVLPSRKKPRPRAADATRREIVELLRRAKSVDRGETGRLYVTLIEAGYEATPAMLNRLRESVWQVLLRKDADAEEVLALVGRTRLVDSDGYRRLLDDLVSAQNAEDQNGLNALRIEAITLLRDQSTHTITVSESLEGCRANPAYELGFVTINTKPWSEVFINGDRVGTTPLAKYRVVAGCVTVRAISPVTGRETVVNATVRPNRTTRLAFDLSESR